MIHLTPKPLPEPQANAIREWLNLPAARAFRDMIAQMAMAAAANGANKALEPEGTVEDALEDAKLEFERARTANNLLTLIANVQEPGFQPSHFDIGPKPTSTPLTEEQE